MGGARILLMIHGIGNLFVLLWFLGSCFKEGMWNNAVTFFDGVLAMFVAFPLWAATVGIAMSSITIGPDDKYLAFAIIIGAGWVWYLISFAVIHAITDRLSKTKVAFHPLANSIGSAIFAWALTGPLGIFSYPVLILVLLAQ